MLQMRLRILFAYLNETQLAETGVVIMVTRTLIEDINRTVQKQTEFPKFSPN